jgi:hypothetical protein
MPIFTRYKTTIDISSPIEWHNCMTLTREEEDEFITQYLIGEFFINKQKIQKMFNDLRYGAYKLTVKLGIASLYRP